MVRSLRLRAVGRNKRQEANDGVDSYGSIPSGVRCWARELSSADGLIPQVNVELRTTRMSRLDERIVWLSFPHKSKGMRRSPPNLMYLYVTW